MTRRDLLRSLPILGAILPTTSTNVTATQFHVSGLWERTGEGGYAIREDFAVRINPKKLPNMYQRAESMVGKNARVMLEEA
jgi:hypothetical protein